MLAVHPQADQMVRHKGEQSDGYDQRGFGSLRGIAWPISGGVKETKRVCRTARFGENLGS